MGKIGKEAANSEVNWVKWHENAYRDDHCVGYLQQFKTPPTEYYNQLLQAEKHFYYSIRPNLDFNLHFYFPTDVSHAGKKADHLVIMFNGLDEFLPDHLTVYNRLGSEFALRGIASVLFPTPFHLNRAAALKLDQKDSMTQDGKKRPDFKRPSDELVRNPFFIYMNFIQTLREYNRFKCLLSSRFVSGMQPEGDEESDKDFYERYFKHDLNISLLGYSLGGLKALTCFRDNPDHPKSCILLNSGSTIDKIRMKGIMEEDQWRALTDSIVSEQYPSPTLQSLIDHGASRWIPDSKATGRALALLKAVRNDDKYAEVRKVLVGTRPFNERDKQVLSRKLVLVIGGRDKIIPPEDIRRLEPEGSSLNVLHISELGHFPEDDAAFNRWCEPTVNLMKEFIVAPEGTSLSKSQAGSLLLVYDWLCGGTLLARMEDKRGAQQHLREKLDKLTDIDEAAKRMALHGFDYSLVAWQFNVRDEQKRGEELERHRKKRALRFGDIVVSQFGYDESSGKIIGEIIAAKPPDKKTGCVLVEKGYITNKLINNVLRRQGQAYRDLMEEFPEGREWVVPIIKARLAVLDNNLNMS